MDILFNQREDFHKLQLSEIKKTKNQIEKAGGEKKIQKHKAKGKLTARERIEYLLDSTKPQIEIGSFAAYDMYNDLGGCPSAGVIAKIGYVSGKQVLVVANDATVKAGAWFPMTVKKNLRAQEIALENHLPIVYLVDSAGAFLPMQNEVFPDKEDFGRIFRNNAKLSAKGIVQVSAIMGSCVAGGAYLPAMSDESLIVEGTGTIFLAGSYLVKAAIGESIDNETLGGATTHCEISGLTDYKAKDDKDALNRIKEVFSKMGEKTKAGFNKIEPKEPEKSIEGIYGSIPIEAHEPYNTHPIIERIVDADSFDEYKKEYGKTIICGYARIEGWAVGIVANQREIQKNAKGEMQFGGVIYNDSAQKAARFISNCNQKKIPLVFFQDVTGFMVGSKSEHSGIIKDGAKMVSAVAASTVPKFTVIMGNSYGAGNYAMCGKAYDPRLIVGWPACKIAVMGGKQAASVLVDIEVKKNQIKGTPLTDPQKQELLEKITKKYENETSALYAASRLWIDEIIAPTDTRKWISMGIEMANHNPEIEPFNLGVIQT